MEVRVQKRKKKFPVKRKKLHTAWKIAILPAAVIALACVFFLLLSRNQSAEAGLNPTRYSKEHPFEVLEIVPYEGQGQWGYLVGGQEPVSAAAIREFHENAGDAEQYWNRDNQDNTFDIDFKFSGLIKDAANQTYNNSDTFIRKILCRSGGNPEDWAGKVRVKSKSASEVTVREVELADLIVIQSNQTAFQYNAYSESPLYVYWKYNRPDVLLRSESGAPSDPANGGQAVYEGEISKDNGATWKSLDMNWEVVQAVLNHAYSKNKATIVASEKATSGNAVGNMDKLILLLTKLTGKVYVDHGIREMITAVDSGTGVTTGSFQGETAWNEDLFYDAMLLDRVSFVNCFEDLKYYIYNPVQGHVIPEEVKTFLNRYREMQNQSTEEFYRFISPELWDAILGYARVVKSNGKITEEQYQAFVDSRDKYVKKQICKPENKYEIGYDVLHNGGYKGKTEWDNVIRYMEGWVNYPFVPALLAGSSSHQFDVEEILKGGIVEPEEPPEEPEEATVKVLEIQPCNRYWLHIPGNTAKLSRAIGVPEDEISITCVTPGTLNGLAADLTAEYDLILIGDNVSDFSSSGGHVSKPYSHIGYYEDAVVPQTLLNGLLKNDYTTEASFNELLKQSGSLNTLQISGSGPVGSNDPFWNPGIRDQWREPGNYFLKNVELSLMMNEAVSTARFSGNDISRYMQGELARFVRSGQPVVFTNHLRETAAARIEEFNTYERKKTGETHEPPEQSASSLADARLYFAMAGVEDEREYYDSDDLIDLKYLTGGESNIYDWTASLENESGKISLLNHLKPQVRISDAGMRINEEGVKIPTIAGKGKGTQRPELSALAKDNTLTFQFELTIPDGADAKDCVMTVIIDQNGDGIFDEQGEGKTVTEGKKGKQNNAAAEIKNDKVYLYRFADKKEGVDYEQETNLLTGIFTSPGPIDSREEICQFRVIVTAEKRGVPLRGEWTGYLRPDLKNKDIRILQITPYSDIGGGKDLSGNQQFNKWMQEAENLGGEYHIVGYDAVSEGDFAANYQSIDTLKDYHLIISGTDFTSAVTGDVADVDEAAAVSVLRTYSEELKRPIIFTNDAISYVNSRNYLTPTEQQYRYHYLTIAEGKRLREEGGLVEGNDHLFKAKTDEETYRSLEEKNREFGEAGWEGEGTAYLEDSPEWFEEPGEPEGAPPRRYTYVWRRKLPAAPGEPVDESGIALTAVAGEADALYPAKNNWNYWFTQSLRHVLGMDRFAVTTKMKAEEKRDRGSSRRWAKKTAIQGFTNAALLEYSYLPPAGAQWGNRVKTSSPYENPLLALGTAPRTSRIEMLNEGAVGLYPFIIADSDITETKTEIAENHAPYYQLDLDRETGEGKIDDVTVWFTLAGAKDGDAAEEKNQAEYFRVTEKDAGNNYYLYSKGKIFYTGFSLYDKTDGSEDSSNLIPDNEMKLFINTIYAALNSEPKEASHYDTVVREGGAVSLIEQAGNVGIPNRYAFYYDEYDETVTIPFRVQKINAAVGETTPVVIGKKDGTDETGAPKVTLFDVSGKIEGLPEGTGPAAFPVENIAGKTGVTGSQGSEASDRWYNLTMDLTGDMDGMTMLIGSGVHGQDGGTGTLRTDGIYVEIYFVKRNLFELD